MLTAPASLLSSAAALSTGSPVALNPSMPYRPLGVNVFGTFVGTVILEGTIDTQANVDAATATWSAISGASWTAPGAAKVDAPFTHVRARVSAYTSGAISVQVI